jgi:hypothetical protein
MCLRRYFLLLLGILTATTCGDSKGNCPGLCSVENVFPTMTIETADGMASIAKAQVVSGPCAHLLTRSAGEAGVPTGYAAVQVTYNGSTSIPPLCLVELTSLLGETTVVTTQVTISQYQQRCCPSGSCCDESNERALHYNVAFTPSLQTVTFSMVSDAGIDTQSLDTTDPFETAPLDATEPFDSSTLDVAPSLDTGAIDVAEGTPPDVPLFLLEVSDESSI